MTSTFKIGYHESTGESLVVLNSAASFVVAVSETGERVKLETSRLIDLESVSLEQLKDLTTERQKIRLIVEGVFPKPPKPKIVKPVNVKQPKKIEQEKKEFLITDPLQYTVGDTEFTLHHVLITKENMTPGSEIKGKIVGIQADAQGGVFRLFIENWEGPAQVVFELRFTENTQIPANRKVGRGIWMIKDEKGEIGYKGFMAINPFTGEEIKS